jgi:hypothetical protein
MSAVKKAPSVVVERQGGSVRLRGLKWSLPVTLDIEGRGRISVNIKPNTWTPVPDEIYAFLKGKYESPRYTAIPDVEENEDRPHRPGEMPIMTTEEQDPGYFLEFRDK